MPTYVYWIHGPEHCDHITEGYVGVSCNPKRRLTDHRYGDHYNPKMARALSKYGNKIKLTILFEGSAEECYKLEEQYRPKKQIGWNINKGGDAPPVSDKRGSKNNFYGRKHTEETKAKWKLSRVGQKRSEETKAKMRANHWSRTGKFTPTRTEKGTYAKI